MTEFVFCLQDKACDFVTRDIGKSLREALLQSETTVPINGRVTIDASRSP
jgi:hypothetical protein